MSAKLAIAKTGFRKFISTKLFMVDPIIIGFFYIKLTTVYKKYNKNNIEKSL